MENLTTCELCGKDYLETNGKCNACYEIKHIHDYLTSDVLKDWNNKGGYKCQTCHKQIIKNN